MTDTFPYIADFIKKIIKKNLLPEKYFYTNIILDKHITSNSKKLLKTFVFYLLYL